MIVWVCGARRTWRLASQLRSPTDVFAEFIPNGPREQQGRCWSQRAFAFEHRWQDFCLGEETEFSRHCFEWRTYEEPSSRVSQDQRVKVRGSMWCHLESLFDGDNDRVRITRKDIQLPMEGRRGCWHDSRMVYSLWQMGHRNGSVMFGVPWSILLVVTRRAYEEHCPAESPVSLASNKELRMWARNFGCQVRTAYHTKGLLTEQSGANRKGGSWLSLWQENSLHSTKAGT